MPYIKEEDRPKFDYIIEQFPVMTEGEVNYVLTNIALKYIKDKGLRYHVINAVIGVFECAKLEYYRRQAAPYEDEKIKENGDVY